MDTAIVETRSPPKWQRSIIMGRGAAIVETRYIVMSIVMAATVVVVPWRVCQVIVTWPGIVVTIIMTGLQRKRALGFFPNRQFVTDLIHIEIINRHRGSSFGLELIGSQKTQMTSDGATSRRATIVMVVMRCIVKGIKMRITMANPTVIVARADQIIVAGGKVLMAIIMGRLQRLRVFGFIPNRQFVADLIHIEIINGHRGLSLVFELGLKHSLTVGSPPA